RGAGVLPFAEPLAVDRHLERVASGQLALRDVGLDLSDADARLVRVAAEAVDLAADRDLLVEMIVSLALEAGDLGLEARLLDQALVAGCDRLGETELIGLRSDVFDPPDRRIARHGHVDEARLALERLPAGGVDASLGRIGEKLDLVVLVPWRSIRPSRWATWDGSQGTSRWWSATSRLWALTPVPMVSDEPIRIRFLPAFMSLKRRCLAAERLWSCMKAISDAGTPSAISFSLAQR